MPNYIRTQSPWLAAANAMQGVVDPMARMYSQLPQIQMQMQQNADQMGMQQARMQQDASQFDRRLGLDTQEFEARKPLYGAQTQQATSAAAQNSAEAQKLMQMIQFALQASQAETNPALQAITGAATMHNPTGLRDDMTKPYIVPQNATMMDQRGVPVGQGLMSQPLGNNAYTPQQFATNVPPTMLQQGQFRPPGAISIDPSTAFKNLSGAGELMQNYGTPEDMELLMNAMRQALQKTSGAQTNAPMAAPVEQTATNPQTGQKVVLRNGQWVPQ